MRIKPLKIHVLLLLLLLLSKTNVAQKQGQALVDSLLIELPKVKPDTNKVLLLNALSIGYYNIDPEKGISYGKSGLALAQKLGFKMGMAQTCYSLGFNYLKKSDFPNALRYYFQGLKVYAGQTSLTLAEKTVVARINGNIGTVYREMGFLSKAFDYYNRGLKSHQEMNNRVGMSEIYLRLGIAYHYQERNKEALEYFNKALAINREFNDRQSIATNLANLGMVYSDEGEFMLSNQYVYEALTIDYELGIKNHIALNMNTIGDNYYGLAKNTSGRVLPDSLNNAKELLDRAERLQQKSVELLREIRNQKDLQLCYFSLAKTQEYKQHYKEALQSYRAGIAIQDSMFSKKNQQQIEILEDQVKEDLKQREIEIQKLQLAAAEKERIYFIVGLSLLVLFAVFIFNRFRITSRQKKIIEIKEKQTQEQNVVISRQKHLVEEKHKEITDSINYAERIQRSFMATQKMLDENLPEHFVLFKPKDVVSGDFYWTADTFENLKDLNNSNDQILKFSNDQILKSPNDQIFFLAVADSTGHGVPGAIMSILNITCLENAVKEGKTDPAEVLNHTRAGIIERLKKDGSADGGKDGMDCCLLSIDLKNKKLEFALANNPLWLIRNNQLIEYSPDKMPVGKHDKQHQPFTKQVMDLEKGDLVYVFTDGYPDQFGGPKGKKFKYKNLGDLLLKHHQANMAEQKEMLAREFDQWKGGLEQVDDVCVIGIRV